MYRSILPLVALTFVLPGCSKAEKSPTTDIPGPQAPRGPAAVGQQAPDFSFKTQSGKTTSLSEYRGKVVVLYFYPMDNTPGCTQEAKGFRDAHAAYEQRNAVVIGVSTQDSESHLEFAKEYGLPFELVADEDGAIAQSYGAKSFVGLAKRMTFIIGADGKVAHVYQDVSPEDHAAQVLGEVDRLIGNSGPP